MRACQIPAPAQLVDQIANASGRLCRQAAIACSLVQMQLKDTLRLSTMQHIGHKRLPKAPGSCSDKRHNSASSLGHVLDLVLCQTIAAVSATGPRFGRMCQHLGSGILVAKVAQHILAQTTGCLAIALHLGDKPKAILPRTQALLFIELLVIGLLLGKETTQAQIVAVPKQKAARRVAVAAGTPSLLIVSLDALGRVIVDDIAHVGLVDTHAKGVGGNHHTHVVAHKCLLVLRSRLHAHTGVIARNAHIEPLFFHRILQCQRQLVHTLARGTVDDSRLVGMFCHIPTNPRCLLALGHLLHLKR